MDRLKMLGLLAIAAAALMTWAGIASATVPTSSGSTHTSTFKATSTSHSFHGSFITFSCASAGFEGKFETHGGAVTAEGNLTKWYFSECNYGVTVKKAGRLIVHVTSGGNATLTSTGAEFVYHSSVGECVLSTHSTDIGTFTGGTGAKLDIDGLPIPRTGGNFFCGGSIEWTANYTFSTPSNLSFD
jgi:hypothetical protein